MAGKAAPEAGLGLGPTPPALPRLQRVQPPRLHLALRPAPSTPSHRGRLLWEGSEHFPSLSTFLPGWERPGLRGNHQLDPAHLWSWQRDHLPSRLEGCASHEGYQVLQGEGATQLRSGLSPTTDMLYPLEQVTFPL